MNERNYVSLEQNIGCDMLITFKDETTVEGTMLGVSNRMIAIKNTDTDTVMQSIAKLTYMWYNLDVIDRIEPFEKGGIPDSIKEDTGD